MVGLHGSWYVTNDFDICYSRGIGNLRRLVKALAPFHPRLRDLPHDLPFVWDDVTLRNDSVFALATDLGSIDLLAEVATYWQTRLKSTHSNAAYGLSICRV